MIMEAKKSNSLLPMSWRAKKAGDVTQSKFNGPRTWKTDGVKSQFESKHPKSRSADVQGQEEGDVPPEAMSKFTILFLLVLIRPSVDWAMLTGLPHSAW